MANIIRIPFELASTTALMEASAFIGSPSVNTTAVRSGVYGLHVASLSSGTAKGYRHAFALSTNNGPNWIRNYFKFVAFPGAENRIILLNNGEDQSTPLIYLTIDSGGVLRLYDEDGQITGTTTLSTGTWYYIEVRFDRTPVAGSHVVEARVNGAAAFASSSSRDLSASIWVVAAGMNLASEANTTGECYIDDVAINDSSGSYQNGYPGEGEVIALRPDNTGDNSAWTGDYTAIDEVTPNDGTDLISSGTLDQIEDVSLEATPAAMASSDTINCVEVRMRFNLSATTGSDPRAVMRIKASASGTVEESSAFVINTTTWQTNGIGNTLPTLTLYDLPGASTTAWTKADLDTSQVGVRISTGDADLFQVTALWLYVDHKPAGGQSVAVNQATETDAAQATSKTKTRAVAQSTETDIAQIIGRIKHLVIALVLETDQAQAIAAVKIQGVGQVAETDIAQAITRSKRLIVGQSSESDLAQAIGAKKIKAVSQATETDTAQAITARGAILVQQVTETDLAQALFPSKRVAVMQVVEADFTQAVNTLKRLAVSTATEIDLAQAITLGSGGYIISVGQAVELDDALAITHINPIGRVVRTWMKGRRGRIKYGDR